MASHSGRTTITSPEHHPPTKATVIFSFRLHGHRAFIAVIVLFCKYRVRGRAPVTAAVAAGNSPGERRAGVDIAKLPGFAYNKSARRDGGVCSCVDVRRLPLCKNLYHVKCIDMCLASHTTCPLCRADVEPPEEEDPAAAPAEPQQELPV
ncbi:hypothetical protein PVAP13_4NG167000 [Panicum virgatum]|uniref:RING-type domain-containing protein n=1 Tax=Panicum virgatum TaxID=38727 RepID=A0A8T0TBL1_PANVG|nr:hypothetical protein PVAP13_4NG167000 [Panicum virgatum]